jgi:pyruvate dehydrogenase E1 component
MYHRQENGLYYLSVGNENYAQPAMPEGVRESIIRGAYLFKPAGKQSPLKANLLGSGAIMNEVLKAQALLASEFNVAANVYSVTSYNELRREALNVERANLLRAPELPEKPYVTRTLVLTPGVVVAASDHMKALPDSIRPWVPWPMISLGTDGFGRSESRGALRDFFEVDAKHIAWAALVLLCREGEIGSDTLNDAKKKLGINANKVNPMVS